MSTAKPSLQILGMMSGTSVDSIDVAFCSVSETPGGRLKVELHRFHEHPVPARLRERIFQLFKNGPGSLSLACSLNFEIGEAFAVAAGELLNLEGISSRSIDAIASHGQTVWHIAPHMVKGGSGGEEVASTLQIGESAVIAQRLGIPVVSDFRTADMAAGGNGAPLVPFADWHLFSRPGSNVIVLNIGGIANLTYLPASGRIDEVIAFDTGPGNMIVDALVGRFYPGEQYDDRGQHAARGQVIEELVQEWMAIPYVAARPPKSTGRELFGLQFTEAVVERNRGVSPDDLIATATEFTARSIAANISDHVVTQGNLSEILIAGGGAKNPELVERIRKHVARTPGLSGAGVSFLDGTGFPAKARECIAFALLGYAHLKRIPGNVPSATGASRRVVLGKLTKPGA